MSKRITIYRKYALRYVAFAALLILIAYCTRGQWEEFRNVRKIRPSTLVWLSLFFVTSQVLAGLVLRQFTAGFGIALTFREWFGLVCVRSFGNYLPLSTGLTANAAYLKLKRDLPVTQFASLTAGNLILTTLAASLFGVLILLARQPTVAAAHVPLLLFFSIIGAGALAIIVTPLPEIKKSNRLLFLLYNMQEGWKLIRQQRRLLGSVFALQMAILLLIALQYQLVFHDLDYRLDLPSVLLLTVSTSTIRFASLLPANMGVRETIAGAVVHTFGYPFSVGLLAAVITRLVSMVWVFSLGAVFGFVLIRSSRANERTTAGST